MAGGNSTRFEINENGQLVFIREIDKPADTPRSRLNEVAEMATEAHIHAHRDLYDKFVNEQATSAHPQKARVVAPGSADKITTGTLSGANKAAQIANDQERAATERAMRDIQGRKGSSSAKKQVEQERLDGEAQVHAAKEAETARARGGDSYIDQASQQRVRGIDPNKPAAHSASTLTREQEEDSEQEQNPRKGAKGKTGAGKPAKAEKAGKAKAGKSKSRR